MVVTAAAALDVDFADAHQFLTVSGEGRCIEVRYGLYGIAADGSVRFPIGYGGGFLRRESFGQGEKGRFRFADNDAADLGNGMEQVFVGKGWIKAKDDDIGLGLRGDLFEKRLQAVELAMPISPVAMRSAPRLFASMTS